MHPEQFDRQESRALYNALTYHLEPLEALSRAIIAKPAQGTGFTGFAGANNAIRAAAARFDCRRPSDDHADYVEDGAICKQALPN